MKILSLKQEKIKILNRKYRKNQEFWFLRMEKLKILTLKQEKIIIWNLKHGKIKNVDFKVWKNWKFLL